MISGELDHANHYDALMKIFIGDSLCYRYLVKTLTCSELPIDEQSFMDLLHTFFPCIYDVKVCFCCAELKLGHFVQYYYIKCFHVVTVHDDGRRGYVRRAESSR